jgi:hypothetical protein
MIRAALSFLLLATPCTLGAAVTPSLPNPAWPAPAQRSDALLRQTSLRMHNDARRDFGVAPVSWNSMLEQEARNYAVKMAQTDVFAHDPTPGRRLRMGENLWRGQRGTFAYEVMVGLMIDEVEHFRPGAFPHNSRNGRWQEVSHYTQIVWPTTTEIGCALASNASTDYFVCRYAPTGNIDGVVLAPKPTIKMAGGQD